jgi:hypothetical protein
VRRPLAVLGLALAFGAVVAGCSTSSGEPPPAVAAPPQEATLDWVERAPAEGPALVFRTYAFAVTDDGWKAELAIENTTSVGWELGANPVLVGQSFGIMLFATGDLDELERRNAEADLPGLRPARTFDPPLPATLRPGASWRGTVGADGALAAGRYVRVVFGPLIAQGDPPDGMRSELIWITDHAHRLHD